MDLEKYTANALYQPEPINFNLLFNLKQTRLFEHMKIITHLCSAPKIYKLSVTGCPIVANSPPENISALLYESIQPKGAMPWAPIYSNLFVRQL